jgi:2-polyprenyl-3-methyl-5-hydroxy-6-metoxy-1,4-benzoquinol methylase
LTETYKKFLSEKQSIEPQSEGNSMCPYCGGVSSFFVSSTDRNRHTTSQTFRYDQCDNCRLVFMNPIPTDLRPFYEGGYQKIPGSLTELREIAKQEKYRLKPILKYKSRGKLLEVGPWIGIFSCNAKDAGFNVTAIEIDQDCVDFLNSTVGIRALQSSDPAEMLDRMDEKFDVIVLWHCLEHLPSPWLVIQKAAERLAPDGILLLAIPNIESYDFSILRGNWKHLDTPRHLFFYPAKSLVTLCQAKNLAELEVDTGDELSVALSRDAWHTFALSKIPVKYVRGAFGQLLYFFAQRKTKKQRNLGSGIPAVFQRHHGTSDK